MGRAQNAHRRQRTECHLPRLFWKTIMTIPEPREYMYFWSLAGTDAELSDHLTSTATQFEVKFTFHIGVSARSYGLGSSCATTKSTERSDRVAEQLVHWSSTYTTLQEQTPTPRSRQHTKRPVLKPEPPEQTLQAPQHPPQSPTCLQTYWAPHLQQVHS